MNDPKPIQKSEFKAVMEGLGLKPADGPYAVAVSGGSDSMALALLMDEFGPTHFLTFDHGLRRESGEETQKVGEWLKGKGLGHHVLTWEGKKPKTGVQEAARTARYKALEAWCETYKIKFLFLAHHREDQAETVLMRLLKGSGIEGLTGMDTMTPGHFSGEVALVRPLLGLSKHRLLATLKEKNQPWISDPSNENQEFTRVKLRNLLGLSKKIGVDDFISLAGHLSKIKKALDGAVLEALATYLKIYEQGYGVLDWAGARGAPNIILKPALSRILKFISQNPYPPKDEKMDRLVKDMEHPNFKGTTLSGCRILPLGQGQMLICREEAAISEVLPLKAGKALIWDGRFEITFKGETPGLEVKALGEKGWEGLSSKNPEIKEGGIPHPGRTTLPALFKGEEIMAVPHLGFNPQALKVRITFKPGRNL